jgi:hypothetical protein
VFTFQRNWIGNSVSVVGGGTKTFETSGSSNGSNGGTSGEEVEKKGSVAIYQLGSVDMDQQGGQIDKIRDCIANKWTQCGLIFMVYFLIPGNIAIA